MRESKGGGGESGLRTLQTTHGRESAFVFVRLLPQDLEERREPDMDGGIGRTQEETGKSDKTLWFVFGIKFLPNPYIYGNGDPHPQRRRPPTR
mmetsp:Transcript_43635/g.74225  ORF Transcript_43635/g.74225 Transcript_43635/m.74225 type:complete len:93 (+) Transcript_43635:1189-1467(+)